MEESEEESEEDSGEESSDSDTPLALRMDAPPRFSILSSSGKKSPRVEAWVSDGKFYEFKSTYLAFFLYSPFCHRFTLQFLDSLL